MTPLSRRQLLRSAALAVAAAGSVPRLARAQARVKVGTAVLGDYALAGPMVVAVERGFFKQERLDVEYVPFRGGPDLAKAVIAGEILVAATGSTDILVFREAGMPIKMVATHTEGNHFTLNVATDIQQVGELKGKAIGVTRAGATTWIFARMLARQQGWDADRDVKIVALGGLDAQLAALARREIHAYVWGDGGAVTELQGKSRVLMRLDKVTPRWISQIQYTSEDALGKQGEAVRKVQRAIFRAIRLMRDDPREVAGVIADKLGWTAEAVVRAHAISGPLLPHDGTISVEALQTMQDTLLEHGVIKKRLPLEEHYAKEFTPVRF
jgi:NitT/TauT family transport system substrate-binding protein